MSTDITGCDPALRADNSRSAAALCCVFTIINLMMHPLLGDKSPTFSKMQQTASQATMAKHVPSYRGVPMVNMHVYQTLCFN